MGTKRSERLQRVAEQFGRDRDLASRRLGEKRDALDRAEERLVELRDYLDTYHFELEQIRRSGTSAATLQNYAAFLAQLQTALQQQQQNANNARDAFERQMQVWYRARTQVRAVEQAAERHMVIERKALERAEQRQLDDLSLLRFVERRR